MAEMYGELMEMNERLHRDMADKDNVIAKLVASVRQTGAEVYTCTYVHTTPPHTVRYALSYSATVCVLYYEVHVYFLFQGFRAN